MPESPGEAGTTGPASETRAYMPAPPKANMLNRFLGFTSAAGSLGGIAAVAGGATAITGNYFSLASSGLGAATTLSSLFTGNKALKKTSSDVDQAVAKGVDEATQKSAKFAVLTGVKFEFLYAVAALKQVATELTAIENETTSVGLLSQLLSIVDRYVMDLERSEELLDIELPRLATTAALATSASELSEDTRTRYTTVGQRIDATVAKWVANRTLFARSEHNALDFLAAAEE
jgi:hypothetical protein